MSAYKLAPKPLYSRERSYGPCVTQTRTTGLVSESEAITPEVKTSSGLFNVRTDEAILSSEAFSPRNSVRKLIIDRRWHSPNSMRLLHAEDDTQLVNGKENSLLALPHSSTTIDNKENDVPAAPTPIINNNNNNAKANEVVNGVTPQPSPIKEKPIKRY